MARIYGIMRLLVSVMDPGEVGAALAGGADIVDVKDPTAGPLGAPAPHVIRAVRAALPRPYLMSAALGDAIQFSDSLAGSARDAAKNQVDFVKVGLVGGRRYAEELLRRLVDVTGEVNPETRVVALAYADSRRDISVSPFSLPGLAAAAGAHAVMLDTEHKDGISLLGHLQESRLAQFVALGRAAGLWVGLAGSLGLPEIERLRELEPDVVGVRRAVCRDGRGGRVDAALVRRLAHATRCHTAFSAVTDSTVEPEQKRFGEAGVDVRARRARSRPG